MNEEDRQRMEALIRKLEEPGDVRCAATGVPLGPHARLASIALGRGDKPLCLPELAKAEGVSADALREKLVLYMNARPCFGGAWLWCGEKSGHGRTMDPPLDWGNEQGTAATSAGSGEGAAESAYWDAGDIGCGDLVLELRGRLRELNPRQVMKLRATDVGAPEDIPSWCRLTGNRLIKAEKPFYWIERKDD
jgi:tRNA 2-thiouridine synthesizing protein A